MTCTCNHCPACRERLLAGNDRDLLICERMRKARAEEPLAYAMSQSSLGLGRPLRQIYTRSMGAGPGGET